jgi:hypothetical protein
MSLNREAIKIIWAVLRDRWESFLSQMNGVRTVCHTTMFS